MSLSYSARVALATAVGAFLVLLSAQLSAPTVAEASSHREAPLIADDPVADNTDVYAYRSPEDPDQVVIVANYIPLSLPEGGPNYTHFGENVRYEIHVKNQTSAGPLGTATDDITYRFTFTRTNEDPTTFFNIRLGQENLNTAYTLEMSTDGGASFSTLITNGPTPPPNIGPRSIEGSPVGLGADYETLAQDAVRTLGDGTQVFVGPRDDPFFVDLGGVFDLGNIRQQFGPDAANAANARDAVAGFNTHSIVLSVPISTLQKDGRDASTAANILDPDFVIGVWASASRPQIRTLQTDGSAPQVSGPYVQVSRLGMPLTNEAVIPLGDKDRWNAVTPYSTTEQDFVEYFVNPELGLYMGNGAFGPAVPGLSADLEIQQNSYPALNLDGDGDPSNVGSGLNFNNGEDGAAAVLPLVGNGLDIDGTAFAVPTRPTAPGVPTALLGPGEPRRVDILPIFYFGVPNAAPYQLATGKGGLVADTDSDGNLEFTQGKPFIHTFLPITQTPDGGLWGGDMLRLNMATPTTDRTSEEFRDWARLGLIRAAAIGLTAAPFNATTDLEFMPHMDGFPNGRRLEDDVTTIALQAVAGLVLAAVGLPEDDATAGDYSDLASAQLLSELGFLAGPTRNDLPILDTFPFVPTPHNGFSYVKQLTAPSPAATVSSEPTTPGVPAGFLLDQNFPNPLVDRATIRYHVREAGAVRVDVYDVRGRHLGTLEDAERAPGTYDVAWNAANLASGTYIYRLTVNGEAVSTRRATVVR